MTHTPEPVRGQYGGHKWSCVECQWVDPDEWAEESGARWSFDRHVSKAAA